MSVDPAGQNVTYTLGHPIAAATTITAPPPSRGSMSKERSDGTDYYAVLGISQEATAKEITTAYRSLALKHHPDKGAGSAERFHAVSRAYQVLTDVEARRALDALLASRRAHRQREAELDTTRRSMRDDLLQREREARKRKAEEQAAELKLQQEMDRLRKEANVYAARASRAEARQNTTATGAAAVPDDLDRTLKIATTTAAATPVTAEDLTEMLSPYGPVESVAVSKKGTGAVARLGNVPTAKSVMMDAERGVLGSLQFSWAKGHPPAAVDGSGDGGGGGGNTLTKQIPGGKDFENLTLMRMRQRAERAQLRAKLEAEESSNANKDDDT